MYTFHKRSLSRARAATTIRGEGEFRFFPRIGRKKRDQTRPNNTSQHIFSSKSTTSQRLNTTNQDLCSHCQVPLHNLAEYMGDSTEEHGQILIAGFDDDEFLRKYCRLCRVFLSSGISNQRGPWARVAVSEIYQLDSWGLP
jgi:hypothetical protein